MYTQLGIHYTVRTLIVRYIHVPYDQCPHYNSGVYLGRSQSRTLDAKCALAGIWTGI